MHLISGVKSVLKLYLSKSIDTDGKTTRSKVESFYITKLCKAQDLNKIQNFKNVLTYTTLIGYHSIIGIS